MISTQGTESCGSGLGRDNMPNGDKRTKRHLSPTEEESLLACLKILVVKGYKSDNGFQPSYLKKLEALMQNKIPGTDLKGIPHLNSKIHTWKRNYNSLTTILSLSGIGFNDHMVDCSAEQWEQIMKMDANAKNIRNRKWEMYDDWKEVFGKDRATGEHAEDVLDAVNQLFNEEKLDDNYYVSSDQVDDNTKGENSFCGSENGVGINSVFNSERGEVTNKQSGKKRKSNESTEIVAEVLREIGRNTSARLDKLASRIGYDYDLDESKKEAFKLIEDMPGLSLDEKIDLCEILTSKTDRLLIFKSLPEEARAHYAQRLLKSKLLDKE